MFEDCRFLTSIDFSNFDTGNVWSMDHMFAGCFSLASLDLSNFDTSNVKDMESMFEACWSLKSLDLSGSDTSSVIVINSMLRDCPKLSTTIKFSSKAIQPYEDYYGLCFDGSATSDNARITVKYVGADTSARADLSSFPDAPNVSGYAKEALQWAVASGIITGKQVNGQTCIAPKATASRAECYKMLVVANEMING